MIGEVGTKNQVVCEKSACFRAAGSCFTPLSSDSGVSLKEGREQSPSKSATMRNRSELESPLVVSLGNFEAGLGISHQFIVSPATPLHLIPSVTRHIFGRTARDAEIDQLPAPAPSWMVYLAVMVLRWYRKIRPASIGQRCVWDPSCSRYAELAIRQRGMFRGLIAAVSRLVRCRPAKGGIDLP